MEENKSDELKKFLPVRGDGLKYSLSFHHSSYRFLPVRGDGLKFVILQYFFIGWFLPVRGDGLKYSIFPLIYIENIVSPRKGRWIEI